jgi:hypothetical protein
MKDIKYILFGIAFGIILTKAEVISWFRIHNMWTAPPKLDKIC